MISLLPRFTLADADRAFEDWGCNCGPSALACMAKLTLDEARVYLPDFEAKRYTNPMMMRDALRLLRHEGRISQAFVWETTTDLERWPHRGGLVRVQWHGPWMRGGVPKRARYRQTHWIGAASLPMAVECERGVWDCNCLNNGTGWVSLSEWERVVVPAITKEIPKADGKWSITHVAHLRILS